MAPGIMPEENMLAIWERLFSICKLSLSGCKLIKNITSCRT